MAVTITTESPLSADSRAMIEASERALRDVYPPEECFSFSPEQLADKSTQFLLAREGRRPVGCVALVDQGLYGEVKRLYVSDTVRGNGVGRALMEELERAARDIGLGCLLLETGAALEAAMRLYRTLGFEERGPFGDYPDIPSNMFMEKKIGYFFRAISDGAQVSLA